MLSPPTPVQLAFLELMLWILYLVSLFLFHFSVFFSKVFFCPFNLDQFLFFFLTFSASMKLGETVAYNLEKASLGRIILLHSVCIQCFWWEGWIWHEQKSCLSLECADSFTLVVGSTEEWCQVWAGASPLLSGSHYLNRDEAGPKLLEQNL